MSDEELRKLDMDVAREVMGYVYVNGTEQETGDRYSLLYPPDDAADWCRKFRDCIIVETPWTEPWPLMPKDPWSSTIAGAWQVVEKLHADGWHVDMCDEKWSGGSGWACSFAKHEADEGDSFDAVRIKTAPLAICLAALKAVRATKPQGVTT